MDIIHNFFDIFNFRFWLFLAELLYFPTGMGIGLLIYQWQQYKKGSSKDEIQ